MHTAADMLPTTTTASVVQQQQETPSESPIMADHQKHTNEVRTREKKHLFAAIQENNKGIVLLEAGHCQQASISFKNASVLLFESLSLEGEEHKFGQQCNNHDRQHHLNLQQQQQSNEESIRMPPALFNDEDDHDDDEEEAGDDGSLMSVESEDESLNHQTLTEDDAMILMMMEEEAGSRQSQQDCLVVGHDHHQVPKQPQQHNSISDAPPSPTTTQTPLKQQQQQTDKPWVTSKDIASCYWKQQLLMQSQATCKTVGRPIAINSNFNQLLEDDDDDEDDDDGDEEEESQQHTVTAVIVLYNLALSFHLEGIMNSNGVPTHHRKSCLERALSVYTIATKLAMRANLYSTILLVTLHNMGQIQQEFGLQTQASQLTRIMSQVLRLILSHNNNNSSRSSSSNNNNSAPTFDYETSMVHLLAIPSIDLAPAA